jgi:hypothetical protein
MSESTVSLASRILVKLTKMSYGAGTWEDLFVMAGWLGDQVSRELLENMYAKLEEIEKARDVDRFTREIARASQKQ